MGYSQTAVRSDGTACWVDDAPEGGSPMKRRMVGDIVGYSGMMERAEEQTAERLASCQALISE
jgi:hypothetical protein